MSVVRRSITVLGILVLSIPVTFVLTLMLLPVWSSIERRSGIESVGHSGPAEWCFWVVFGCVVLISFGTYFVRLGGAARDSIQSERRTRIPDGDLLLANSCHSERAQRVEESRPSR